MVVEAILEQDAVSRETTKSKMVWKTSFFGLAIHSAIRIQSRSLFFYEDLGKLMSNQKDGLEKHSTAQIYGKSTSCKSTILSITQIQMLICREITKSFYNAEDKQAIIPWKSTEQISGAANSIPDPITWTKIYCSSCGIWVSY